MPELALFLHDEFVGELTPARRNRSSVTLTVDPAYQPPVNLTESFIPLPGAVPPVAAVSNFLGGYVPEGNHRVRMAAKRHIDADNLFELLTEFGGSIAGAVTLRRQDESRTYRPSYEPMNTGMLEKRLKQALADSDQGIPDDSRSTLPGYQPKILAARFQDDWVYPHGRAHSTHILKPQVPARPHRVFDEHYSHLLAGHMGLSGYKSELHSAGDTVFLAIERFDREINGEQITLHHQEDLAQALSLDWQNTDVKFQEPSSPKDSKRASARGIGSLLDALPRGASLVEAWIKQLTYHVAIGNNDAHAKNVALMHLPHGTELSPIYDALPNFFQEGLISWNLALAIDGEFDHRRISVDSLLREIESWHAMNGSRAETVVADTLKRFGAAIAKIDPPNNISPGLIEQLQWNLARLLAGDEIGERP